MRAAVLMLVLLAACGDSFNGTTAVDAGADGAPDAPTMPVNDAAEPDAGDASPVEPDVDAAVPDAAENDVHADAGTGDGDSATCTPITYTEPPTCACFFAGSCPADAGASCLWTETPLTITGQPTCRGCGKIAFKPNPCQKCKETFSCACLSPYLDPGQKCCDGPGGPYLTDYACP